MNWWEEPKIKCTATDATRNLQLKWKQSRVSVRARWSEKNIIIYQSICKINVKRLCSCCPSNVLHTHHDRAVACLRCFPLSLCLSHFIFSATTKCDFSKKKIYGATLLSETFIIVTFHLFLCLTKRTKKSEPKSELTTRPFEMWLSRQRQYKIHVHVIFDHQKLFSYACWFASFNVIFQPEKSKVFCLTGTKTAAFRKLRIDRFACGRCKL